MINFSVKMHPFLKLFSTIHCDKPSCSAHQDSSEDLKDNMDAASDRNVTDHPVFLGTGDRRQGKYSLATPDQITKTWRVRKIQKP